MKTYIFVVDDYTVTILDINTIGGAHPALPEVAIYPGKANSLLVILADGNAHILGSPQGALVITVIGFLNTQLFGITEFGSLKTEKLNLLVHPLKGGLLQFALGLLEIVGTAAAKNTENDKLSIHDLSSVRSGKLRKNGEPHSLHPRQDLSEVSHVFRSKSIVIVGPSFADHQETWPSGDLEALGQSGTASFDNASMPHQAESETLHRLEVLGGGCLVIEVQEEDLLGLF